MEHAQHVEGDNLREMAKNKKKVRTLNYEYYLHTSSGGNRSKFQQRFTTPTALSASAPSVGFGRIRKEGHQAQSTTSVVPSNRPTR